MSALVCGTGCGTVGAGCSGTGVCGKNFGGSCGPSRGTGTGGTAGAGGVTGRGGKPVGGAGSGGSEGGCLFRSSSGDEGLTGGVFVGGKSDGKPVGKPEGPGDAGGCVPELTATIAPITTTIPGIRQRP